MENFLLSLNKELEKCQQNFLQYLKVKLNLIMKKDTEKV